MIIAFEDCDEKDKLNTDTIITWDNNKDIILNENVNCFSTVSIWMQRIKAL